VGYGIAPGSAASSGSSLGYDDFTGDGTTTIYTISSTVLSSSSVDVFIDGIYQSKDNYTANGTTVTFSTAPPFLSHIEIVAYGVNNVGSVNAVNTIFNAALSGSVNRTAQSKMAEIPSVRDFGAIGDGLTDDTAAFNAAWAATDPQAVYVPAASYAITGTVTGKFFSFGVVTIVSGTVTTITNLVP
jgi:polygalacturonase